jgi:hypothetical protein
MGNDSVKVRCDLDTYSLSAHADESELISIAEAFDPQEIMLVHGDEGPRHSLATGLRQRQRLVTTPRTGTERVFNFAPRPWAVGAKLQSGSHSGAVNIAKLWESLKNRAGDTFSARELAQVWWGDGERAAEMVTRLGQPDNLHFAADWRSKTNFTVRSEAQVARMELQRANMLRYPDIVGKLIMFRNSNDQPRLGVVTSADVGSFEAIAHNSKGTHFTGDTLLWDLGKWEGYGDKKTPVRTQLNELFKDARAQVDSVLPALTRQKLVDAGQAIDPATLLPQSLPDGLMPQVALTAVVLGLALDGAVLEADGLRPRRARISGTLEQNEARDLALSLFPPEARLRKVGMEIHRNRLLLSFDFPQAAERQYADLIEDLIDRSGWDVQVKPQVNQQALAIALEELLPEGVRLTKGLSYFMDKREVVAELDGLEDSRELERKFLEVTDFKLTVQRRQQAQAIAVQVASSGEQLEINQAYAVLRQALEPLGMYKAGLKQGQIVLSFISPQLGERFTAQISELAQQTGYTLSVHPHPNQQKILEIVQRKIAAAGWQILKGPSIFTDRAAVALTLVQRIDPVAAEKIQQEVLELTGYALELG